MILTTITLKYFQQTTLLFYSFMAKSGVTRKLCYRKDDRTMRPNYGRLEILIFLGLPDYAHGYFSQNFMGFCLDGTARKRALMSFYIGRP